MKQLLLGVILLLGAVGVEAQTAQRVIGTNTLPATCHAGPNPQVYVDTNATTTAQFYICTSTNHWTAQGGGGGGDVSSVFGRTGAVVAVSGDYTFDKITGVAQGFLLGRGASSGTGAMQQITIGSGLTLTGTTLTSSGSGGANTALSNLASVAINTSLVSDTNNTDDLGTSGIKWRTGYFATSVLTPNVTFTTSVYDSAGAGSPEGAVTASVGSTYRRTNGGAATTLYVKESGSGNTGWVAAGSGSGTVTSIATTGPIGGGTITSTGTITCTTCVTSAASLTSTAIMTGAGSQGSQTPSATATLDSSGNVNTPGYVATGVGGGVAGNVGLGQGTATSVAANTIQHQAPTSVTGYNFVYPSAAASGLLQWTNSANVLTGTFSALTSGRVTFATTNGLLSDDSDLTFSGSTLTATNLTVSTAATVGGLTVATKVAGGTSALGTSAIGSGACASVVTGTATGTVTTDTILWGFNGDPTGVTGYVPSANGMLTIIVYPAADATKFLVCNNTSGSITPGAITLNWKVLR